MSPRKRRTESSELSQIGDGSQKSGWFTGLGKCQQFSNAAIHFLAQHKNANRRPEGGIELPINGETWKKVLEIEFLNGGQSLQDNCAYYNGGTKGFGYDKDGLIDFGTGHRTPKQKVGQSVAKTDKAVYPLEGKESLLQPMEVIELVLSHSEEIVRGRISGNTTGPIQISERLERQSLKLEMEGRFDPNDDDEARQFALASIARRYGREQFRSDLIEAYGGLCAITECNVREALEAAHIKPYNGQKTNHVTNGLFFRCDIHILFDLNLIGIDPESFEISIVSRLFDSSYEKYVGRKIRLPNRKRYWPNTEALSQKWDEFQVVCKAELA